MTPSEQVWRGWVSYCMISPLATIVVTSSHKQSFRQIYITHSGQFGVKQVYQLNQKNFRLFILKWAPVMVIDSAVYCGL
jgi:hypothetical protein